MKKILSLLLILLLLISAAACSREASVAEVTESPAPSEEVEVTETPDAAVPDEPAVPEESAEPAEEDADEPEDTEDEPWAEIYTAFLEANYDALNDACFGGLTGIGYIDLDTDGSAELLIFDAGASASMGIQIFDIINGEVELISANMLAVAELYRGDYYSELYVNANYFDDFRLMEDLDTGERFFVVTSTNGALDFSFQELIGFSGGEAEDWLHMSSLLYAYEEYDIDSGELSRAVYRIGSEEVGEAEYSSALSSFEAAAADTGYEAAGAFLWENGDFASGIDGFLAMNRSALEKYAPLPEPEVAQTPE